MAIKARQSLEGETIVFMRKTDRTGKETRQASETQNLIQQEMLHPVCTTFVHSASMRTWPSLCIQDQMSEPCYCRAVVTAANNCKQLICWPRNVLVPSQRAQQMSNFSKHPSFEQNNSRDDECRHAPVSLTSPGAQHQPLQPFLQYSL